MMSFARSFVAPLLCGLLMASAAVAESWTVELSKKQERALAELRGKQKVTALAISPDGAWGNAWGKVNEAEARAFVLGHCRAHLRRGKRDCFVYMVNGKVVAPKQVQTRKVSQVYKPGNGKLAPQVIGRVNAQFQGDRASAEEDFARLQAHQGAGIPLNSDRDLARILRQNSLMSTSKSGFAIYFDRFGGGGFFTSNSGGLTTFFDDWRATQSGLVCWFGARYDTGKQIGTQCLYIDQISKGAVAFSWASSAKTRRKGQIIAGDARLGAVR
jgi:hypothetical protein